MMFGGEAWLGNYYLVEEQLVKDKHFNTFSYIFSVLMTNVIEGEQTLKTVCLVPLGLCLITCCLLLG